MSMMLMTSCLFKDAYFHTMCSEDECYEYMGVTDGRISYLGHEKPEGYIKEISLDGGHVYPALIDAHMHLLYTMVLSASSFLLCEIEKQGIRPDTLCGMKEKIEAVSRKYSKEEVIVGNQYIPSAVREKRLPTRAELDEWTDNRKIVIYNIDGHSSAMSSEMLEAVGIEADGHSGILSGKDHEFIQGRVMEVIGKSITPAKLARGIGNFTNLCIDYGIGTVCALDGNGDLEKDSLTGLLAAVARRMDIGVRLYPQFMDLKQAEPFRKYQRRPRIGGCGVWEMDGSVGSHSAAFYAPYKDTGKTEECYYHEEKVAEKLREAHNAGYQISSHAIGEKAIDLVLKGYEGIELRGMHRIDHFEFPTPEAVETLIRRKAHLALTVQPGFSWIDRYYLNSYQQHLPEKLIRQQVPLKRLMEEGVCVCGSSDAPVQDINPYTQMLGMIDFYLPEQSLSPYEALLTYTRNPAQMLCEENERGTLAPGKEADFFVTDADMFKCSKDVIGNVKAKALYMHGKRIKKKKGTVFELMKMFLGAPHKI